MPPPLDEARQTSADPGPVWRLRGRVLRNNRADEITAIYRRTPGS